MSPVDVGAGPGEGGPSVETKEVLGAGARVASLIARHPALAARFERLGIDFCCHGDRPLSEACAAAGVPLVEALDLVAAADADHHGGYAVNWPQMRLVDLVDHIEDAHHRYLHLELASLMVLASKVQSAHGDRHPELAEVESLVSDLRDDFVPHLTKEEQVLFPAIRKLATGHAGHTGFAFGSLVNPISVMMSEHESVGRILHRLRDVSSGYTVPADGCQSYRRLYERLSFLEADTHVHVLKENSFLFPRAVELEAALAGR